ncbi:MAG: DNA repair protein RadC [Candidatus Nanohaloarchaea archaeon]
MDYTIHDLPQEERPREKLEENGVDALSDAELLAILLRTGIKGKNVKELSYEILEKFDLQDISKASIEEFKELEGISQVKAGQMKAIGELGLRLQREDRQKIESLSDVKACVDDMKFQSSESLRVFYLNSGNEVISEQEFDGSVSTIKIEPKEIFAEGLKKDASALILAHNHPSGDSGYTNEDKVFTENLIDLGSSLGLDILDHIIVGKNVRSMRDSSGIWQGV